MANDKRSLTRHSRGKAMGAAALGVVTASVGIITPPAQAAPSYPSWNDVQQAKKNEATTKAEITTITALVQNLSDAVDAASKAAEISAEDYFEAQNKLAEATAKEKALRKQADAAGAKAKISQMRAGLLAAHLARTGGGNLSLDLLLEGDDSTGADTLLYQLGTMSKLTERSQMIYGQALADKNSAEALTKQADVAATEREKLATAAQAALVKAQADQKAAQDALAVQKSKSTELVAQLASLKNTTAEVESGYLAGVQKRKEEAAAKKAAEERKRKEEAAAKKAAEERKRKEEQGQRDKNKGGNGGSTAPTGGGGSSNPAPNGSVVANAIAYANAQLGKPYVFGGEGPYGYDCSGLTMMAYRYAGVYIGAHGVRYQYNYERAQGNLVPYSARKPGDLIFWGSSPGSLYHMGIYIGGGMMIAAPTFGDVVKRQAVWGAPWYLVARPSR